MITNFANTEKSGRITTTPLNNALKDVGNTNARAAETANNISAKSQAWAAAFNSAMANNANTITQLMQANQAGYNAEQAAAANKLQQEYWKHSADYNSEEAEKNRQWQEYMSSTAYQRAVEDLKKAGLNPILAAMNGGAFTGGGATATMGPIDAKQASIGNGMGTSASVGNYSGILENTSNELALFGAVYDGIQSLISSAQDAKYINSLSYVAEDLQNATSGFITNVKDKITSWKNKNNNNNSNTNYRTNSYKEAHRIASKQHER